MGADHRIHAEERGVLLAVAAPRIGSKYRVVHDGEHLPRESFVVAGWHEEAVYAVFDDFGNAAYARRHNRFSHGERLEKREGQPLPKRRRGIRIEGIREIGDIAPISEKAHALPKPPCPDDPFEACALQPLAHHDDSYFSRARREPSGRIDHRIEPLLRCERGYGAEDEVAVGDAELASDALARSRRQRAIDAIVEYMHVTPHVKTFTKEAREIARARDHFVGQLKIDKKLQSLGRARSVNLIVLGIDNP